MMSGISKERWLEAQAAERKCHKMTKEEGIQHYSNAYRWNFHYCGIEPDLKGKKIIEIGCADFPALRFCKNYIGFIIEPMDSVTLDEICGEFGLFRIKSAVEEIELPMADEVWLFNVMQHVIDPDKFIENCKKAAGVIRFFEPLDCEITEYHPHSITMEDLKRWFVHVNLYNDNQPQFHDGPCGYGVWTK